MHLKGLCSEPLWDDFTPAPSKAPVCTMEVAAFIGRLAPPAAAPSPARAVRPIGPFRTDPAPKRTNGVPRSIAGGAAGRWPTYQYLSGQSRSGLLSTGQMMRKTEREPDAVDLLNRFEELRFLQRPELGRRSSRAGRHQQTIYRTARCFVSRLHAGDIGVGAHVVGSHKEILQFDLGFRPILKRTCRVDEQRLGIRGRARVGEFNVRIKEPGNEVCIVNRRASR